MAHLDWLFELFSRTSDAAFMVWQDRPHTYGWLAHRVEEWTQRFDSNGIPMGATVSLRGDYSPEIVAALLALIDRSAIVIPLSPAVATKEPEFLEIAEAQYLVTAGGIQKLGGEVNHPLYLELHRRGTPGLVLFSSGSTGNSKAALHDFAVLLEKFRVPRRGMVTLTFLMIDHIGGINTLFYVLSNSGTLVVSPSRDPNVVCDTIARHKVELLPTSPTFLNLLLLSEAGQRHDLSSLKLITYGTEMMPKRTLERIAQVLPQCVFQQTYGLSELGILRSKSESSQSLFVKVGGEGYDTQVRDGILWIKARTAMLGYLNAPSPFDSQGWFNTGDMVEQHGEYIRFLGRESEIINVGGQKVYPAEVEEVLLAIPNVRDVTVAGEPNPITGNIVVARCNLIEPEESGPFKKRVREFCRARMEPFKIPARIEIVQNDQFSGRFKKMRRQE